MDSNKDTKWSKLRARLHMLGYNDNLGEESVQLVEQLFSDLVHTTESLRESQRSTAKSEKESQNSDVRLTRENQELHFELMMVRGERAQVTRELKVYITKLENDVTLLKSLNEQYLHELHSLEKDCKEKAKLIRQLRRKNVNIWVQAVDRNNLMCASPNADDLWQGEVTNLKAEQENSQESIRHSNNQTQMDELQETNMALEQKLKSAQHKSSSKVMELTSKNHELCQEITDIRNLAKKMAMEKKQKLEKAELKLQDLKAVIRKLQGVIRELEDQLRKNTMTSELPDEREGEPKNIDHRSNEAYNLREQNEKFEAMLEFLEEQNSRLQAKVEKMMSVEKVLVLELEGWRTKYGICGLERSPSRLDAFVQSLEEERDHYRQEVEHYKNVRGRSPVIEAQDSLNRTPKIQKPRDRFKGAENKVQQEVEQVTEDILEEGLQQMQEKPAGPSAEIRNLKEQLRLAKAKIAEVLEELQGAKEKLQRLTSEKDSLGDHLKNAEMDIQLLKSGKDELMEELKQKQLQYEEHHSKTSAEMLKLDEKLKDSLKEELKILQLNQGEQQSNIFAEIVKLEEKLRLAEEEIQQLTAEKDSLKKELENQQLKHDEKHQGTSAETIKLEKKLRLAEEKIQQLTGEKDSLKKELENQQLKHDEKHQGTSAETIKLEQKLRLAEAKIQQLITEKDSLKKLENPELPSQVLGLRDRERQMDARHVGLLPNPEETARERLPVSGLRQQQEQIQYALLDLQQMLSVKNNELLATQSQMEKLKDIGMTVEPVPLVAYERMEEALREREELKLRVHSYVNTVSRIENILKTKDQEIQDLAERFRSDVQEREQRLQQVEGFIGTVRMELLSSETERQHLHEVLGKKVWEIQQHMHGLETYKAQVATLAQETSRLEEEVRVHQEEKVTLLTELVSVKEVCVKMDAEKEIAARQLLLKSMELERAMTREEDALTEAILIKEHLANEKLVVRNVEAMLSTSRQEMFQTHQEVSEKEAELKALRQKLALADDKIAAHAREVTNLRRKIDHLQTEMEVLSRKGHERNALEDTPSQDVSFRPLRASSPLDHQPASHQPAPNTSI
ncbi:centrosomal protein of 135 kDa-like [Syngnathus typhle]